MRRIELDTDYLGMPVRVSGVFYIGDSDVGELDRVEDIGVLTSGLDITSQVDLTEIESLLLAEVERLEAVERTEMLTSGDAA